MSHAGSRYSDRAREYKFVSLVTRSRNTGTDARVFTIGAMFAAGLRQSTAEGVPSVAVEPRPVRRPSKIRQLR